MRALIACAVAGAALAAAPGPLTIVNPTVQQSEDGTPLPPGFTHVPGEILFLGFLIDGYQVSAEKKVHLTVSADAMDPKGIRIVETKHHVVDVEIAPEDKEWKPKVRFDIAIPPLAPSGDYTIHIDVLDDLAKTEARKELKVEVRGREVPPSDTLTVRNFRFFRGEEETEPLPKAVYRPGDTVFARFDITGYKYGKENAIDTAYDVAVATGEGKVLWSQANAAVEQSTSFYPKAYIPGSMGINLQKTIRPGVYAIVVTVHDRIGNQDFETKQAFSVE